MCNKRCWDAAAAAISLLIAAGLLLLDIFGLLLGLLIPILALVFGALWLLLATLIGESVLRQNACFDGCVIRKASRVIVAALALILAGALTLLLPSILPVVPLILHFILSALFVYAALALGCLLLCLVRDRKAD